MKHQMPRTLASYLLVALLTLTAALMGAVPASAAKSRAASACADRQLKPTDDNLSAVQQATVCLVNSERASQRLGVLKRERRLDTAARRHAADMVAHRYFAHSSRDGKPFSRRIKAAGYMSSANGWLVGENLAWGTGTQGTPEAIVAAWMKSPGHRANILNARFDEIGIGVEARNPDNGGEGGTYVTEFGTRG